MASLIPKTIHMVWLDKSLYVKQLETIQSWAEENPSYNFVLWCRLGNQENFAIRIAEQFEINPFFNKVVTRRAYDQIIIEVYKTGRFPSSTLSMDEPLEREEYVAFDVHIRGIEIVQPVAGARALYEEIHQWRGMPTREDTAGVAVLHAYGGILVDMATHTGGMSLPDTIWAPRDILFGRTNDEPPDLIPAIIAASPRAYSILTLSEVYAVHKLIGDERISTNYPEEDDYVFVENTGAGVSVREARERREYDFEKSFHPDTGATMVPLQEATPEPKKSSFFSGFSLFKKKSKVPAPIPSSEVVLPQRPASPVKQKRNPFLTPDYDFSWNKYTVRYLVRRWYAEIETPHARSADIHEYVFETQTGCRPRYSLNDFRYQFEGYVPDAR